MGNPFGIPLPTGPLRKRQRRTRQTRRGLVTDYATLETTDIQRGVEEIELRSSPPLACGHVVTKASPYGGTCSVCGVTEFCKQCQLRCARCQRVLFACCAVLYGDDGAERYHCIPCAKIARRRYIFGAVWDAFKQPFIGEEPDDAA